MVPLLAAGHGIFASTILNYREYIILATYDERSNYSVWQRQSGNDVGNYSTSREVRNWRISIPSNNRIFTASRSDLNIDSSL